MIIYYHIYLLPQADVTVAQVEKKMNLALDWYRYGTNLWIVKSTSDPSTWQVRLKSLVEPDGALFICKLDITEQQGWMPKKFWKWLNENKTV